MAVLLILAINLLTFTAINAARILFSLYTLSLGGSEATVGAIMAVLYLFPLLLSWPIGVLADRFSPRWLLAGGAAAGAFGMLAPYYFPTVGALFVASALLGFGMAFSTVIGQSLIGILSTPENRARNFSNYAMSGAMSIFLGPVFAGLSIDHLGYELTCGGIALVMLWSVVALLFWGKLLPRSEPKVRTDGNLLHTLADRKLWGMLAISALTQLGSDIFQIFLPVYAHGVGMSATAIGTLLSVLAATSFAVRLLLVRLIARFGEGRLLALALFIGAFTFALVPLFTGFVPLAILAVTYGACHGCTQPLTMMMMFNNAQAGRAGEAIGLRMTTNNLSRMLGPMLFGGVAAIAGLLAVFWINGLLLAAGGRYTALGARKRADADTAP